MSFEHYAEMMVRAKSHVVLWAHMVDFSEDKTLTDDEIGTLQDLYLEVKERIKRESLN